MKNPASRLLDRLATASFKNQMPMTKKSYTTLYNELEAYLERLCTKHLKRTDYTQQYLIGQIFQTVIPSKNWKGWNKKQLFAAHKTLQRIREDLTKDNRFDANGIKSYGFIISNLIFDLKPIIEYLESTVSEPFVLFKGGKSTIAHSSENFLLSNQMLYNSVTKTNWYDSKTILIASPFVLRHALELKMKRIIGLNNVFNSNYTLPRLKHDFMFQFFKSNLEQLSFSGFEFATIKQIFEWCNVSVHYGIMPRVWEMETALNYTQPFFSGIATPSNFNINGAVTVTKLHDLRIKFESMINSKWPDENFTYNWSESPEALIT